MPSERSLWKYLRNGMKGRWRAQRLEDKFSEGIPDLCYAIEGKSGCGFIELKYKAVWPKRESTPLRLRHFTKAQKLWIKSVGEFSGTVYLLLQVKYEYFLFRWREVEVVGQLTRDELIDHSIAHWECSIDWDTLTELLS